MRLIAISQCAVPPNTVSCNTVLRALDVAGHWSLAIAAATSYVAIGLDVVSFNTAAQPPIVQQRRRVLRSHWSCVGDFGAVVRLCLVARVSPVCEVFRRRSTASAAVAGADSPRNSSTASRSSTGRTGREVAEVALSELPEVSAFVGRALGSFFCH